MAIPAEKDIKRNYFSKVPEAREVLKKEALTIIDRFLVTLQNAEARGDFETASKGYQWLMEHFPAHEDGTTLIDQGIDKPKVVQGYQGPSIQIGIAMGGVGQPKTLPAKPEPVVTVEAIPIKSELVE